MFSILRIASLSTNLSFWCWVFFEFSLGIFFCFRLLEFMCLSLFGPTDMPSQPSTRRFTKKNHHAKFAEYFQGRHDVQGVFLDFWAVFFFFFLCNFRKSGVRSRLAYSFHRQKPPAKLHKIHHLLHLLGQIVDFGTEKNFLVKTAGGIFRRSGLRRGLGGETWGS